jgi:hypothetical protein
MAEDARFRGDFTELAVDPLADPESTRDSIEAQHYLTPRYAAAQPKTAPHPSTAKKKGPNDLGGGEWPNFYGSFSTRSFSLLKTYPVQRSRKEKSSNISSAN